MGQAKKKKKTAKRARRYKLKADVTPEEWEVHKAKHAYRKVQRRVDADLRDEFLQSLNVLPKILEHYDPPSLLTEICEYMLSRGENDPGRVCEMVGISVDDYILLMRNPRNIAWMSQVFVQHIPYLIGRLDMVMYDKAMRGSVAAYKAVIDRFNFGGVKRSVNVSINASGSEVAKLTDVQLDKMVEHEARKQNVVVTRGEGVVPDSAEGEGAKEKESPPPVLRPTPEAEGVPPGWFDLPPEDSP